MNFVSQGEGPSVSWISLWSATHALIFTAFAVAVAVDFAVTFFAVTNAAAVSVTITFPTKPDQGGQQKWTRQREHREQARAHFVCHRSLFLTNHPAEHTPA